MSVSKIQIIEKRTIMEIKKAPEIDPEKERSTYYLIGYTFVLALLFVGFEWSYEDIEKPEFSYPKDIQFEEEIIHTFMNEPPPPPLPVETQPILPEPELTIVDNREKVPEAQIVSVEDDQNIDQPFINIAPPPPVEEETSEEEIFTTVEELPEFPGGSSALMAFLNKEILYPTIAIERYIQGRVLCSFIVNRDGSIDQIEILRSVDPSLDNEAIRVLKKMPKWKPGKQNGRPVRARFTMPVSFHLR